VKRQQALGIQNSLLAALLNHWGVDDPHVVAHDFGGATALRAHLLNGSRYASLTLIDPVAIAPWGSPFVQHVRRHEPAFSGLPGYIHNAILRAYIQGATFRPLSVDDLQSYVTPWTGEIGQAAFYRQIAQMDQKYTEEIEGRFDEISCPVMLLWGEEDRWIPIERGEEVARRIPSSKFMRTPGAGHLMQEDAPEAIVAHLMSFLSA
jgi:pimeloyl-ACP methyl ester carboxylesterase